MPMRLREGPARPNLVQALSSPSRCSCSSDCGVPDTAHSPALGNVDGDPCPRSQTRSGAQRSHNCTASVAHIKGMKARAVPVHTGRRVTGLGTGSPVVIAGCAGVCTGVQSGRPSSMAGAMERQDEDLAAWGQVGIQRAAEWLWTVSSLQFPVRPVNSRPSKVGRHTQHNQHNQHWK